MEGENNFEALKKHVSDLRKKYEEEDDIGAWDDMFAAETIQNAVEAASLDGADPDEFLKEMMEATDSATIQELAEKHGNQDVED